MSTTYLAYCGHNLNFPELRGQSGTYNVLLGTFIPDSEPDKSYVVDIMNVYVPEIDGILWPIEKYNVISMINNERN